jgi:hypothetical protein
VPSGPDSFELATPETYMFFFFHDSFDKLSFVNLQFSRSNNAGEKRKGSRYAVVAVQGWYKF